MDFGMGEITLASVCQMIETLDVCMDNFLYVCDFHDDYYIISPSAKERFKIKEYFFEDIVGGHREFVYPEDWDMLAEDLAEVRAGRKDLHNLEYRWLDCNGEPVWINCRGVVVKDSKGAPNYMIGCINEMGRRQKADNVSGLLGEASFRTYMNNVYQKTQQGFLLRIGIDNFKDINANKGVEYGDQILRKTADCMREVMEPGQNLYRIVADEFIVLDYMGGTVKDANQLYRKIRHKIDALIEESNYEVFYTISGGVLGNKQMNGQSVSHIMKLSEFTLSQAKRAGKNQCYLFAEEDYEQYRNSKRLVDVLRRAIDHDFEGFEAYFQPIVDAQSHRIIMAETLTRFHTEETGFVPPDKFIPILEETGLIIPMGRWILHEALAFCKKVQRFLPDFKVSVNVSHVQVMKSDFYKAIVAKIEEFGLKPESLVVELTESGLLETNTNLQRFCKGIRKSGIQLALDDFGTGYSNFHYLYDLKPNIVKIDRSFTSTALTNTYEYNLLNKMIDMAHSIELSLCTEGIETQEELDIIARLEPDYIQGYFFGRPSPPDVLFKTHVKEIRKIKKNEADG